MPRVAVVGAGIAGLVAARRLADTGADPVVLEAGDRVGGQIRTVDNDGLPVDVGAEALHTAAPQVLALVEELGLDDDLVAATRGTTWIHTPGGLRRMPAGLGPAGPTRLWPLVSSRVLSLRGTLRAGLEPLLPRADVDQDTSIGGFLTHRFGREAVDRLIDPLLGNLHAGDVSRLSLLSATPMLAALAGCHRSLLLAGRSRNGHAPAFVSFRRGLTTLAEALAADPRIEVRLGHRVDAVSSGTAGVHLEGTEPVDADAVVLAVPAAVAATLLARDVPDAAVALEALRTASVATVVASYPTSAVTDVPALAANGVLLPSTSGRTLKAATFLSHKWPHLAAPDRFLVRLSAGRARDGRIAGMSDEQLVTELHGDLAAITGLADPPSRASVHRWPSALAQLEVGHLDRLSAIDRALKDRPAIALAGAAYAGVGIAACIRSGDRAALTVTEQLTQLRSASS